MLVKIPDVDEDANKKNPDEVIKLKVIPNPNDVEAKLLERDTKNSFAIIQ